MYLATAEQMANLDKKTIFDIGIPGVVLMENAGRGTAEIILKEFSEIKKNKVSVIAGKGNNGGDGYVIARYLINKGIEVKVFILSEIKNIKGDAKINLDILLKMGIKPTEILDQNKFNSIKKDILESKLIIDGIFGTGLSSEVKGLYKEVIEFINQTNIPIVSIDIPSGLSASTGNILGTSVKASLTCTFGLAKIGQVIYPGVDMVGKLHIIDISIPSFLIDEADIKTKLIDKEILSPFFKSRSGDSHKGDFGHLLVLSGSPGKTGAAYMVSESAMRVGTGLVTLGIPASLNPIMENKLTEAMTYPLPETSYGTLGDVSLPAIWEILDGKKAIVIGPGISVSDETFLLIKDLIKENSLPMVVDADGITLIAKEPEILLKSPNPIILTPHPGEMARLLNSSTLDVQKNRIKVAQNFAKKYNVVLVLKGARTVIATPDGYTFINPTGNPGMASGGTGDVLTGMIGGFLAQGFSPKDAAVAGVYLHGLAGDIAAKKIGEIPLIATDIIDNIGEAINRTIL